MKTLFFALLLAPAALFAKTTISVEEEALSKAVEQAGGYSKYERLETLTCAFEETVYTASAPVVIRGRRAFRLHDEGGFRAWEDAQTPDGRRLTVVTSSGSFAALDGKAVPAGGTDLAAEAFWMMGPQWVRESKRPLHVLPSGKLFGRLVDRFLVGDPPLFAGADGLILCLHQETGQMDGALFGDEAVYFHEYETTKAFLVVPTLRAHTRGGKKSRLVKLSNVVVNGYVDDALFQIPTQGAHP